MRALLLLILPLLSCCNDLQKQLAQEGALRCTGSAVKTLIGSVKPDVAGALAAADWQARMDALGAANAGIAGGLEAIRCAVQELLGGLLLARSVRGLALLPASADPQLVRDRALLWLKEHP